MSYWKYMCVLKSRRRFIWNRGADGAVKTSREGVGIFREERTSSGITSRTPRLTLPSAEIYMYSTFVGAWAVARGTAIFCTWCQTNKKRRLVVMVTRIILHLNIWGFASSLKIKVTLFRKLVMLLLCRIWFLEPADFNTLYTFQKWCLYQILEVEITYLIRNAVIRDPYEQQPTVVGKIPIRRLRWLGYFCRAPQL